MNTANHLLSSSGDGYSFSFNPNAERKLNKLAADLAFASSK